MNVLSLFAGIGGFDLGLERAGFHTVAFCEVDQKCQMVLAKHWPGVPCYDDVRNLTAEQLATDGISVDVICGGFPCQDISHAGKKAGISGGRSGLWREYARLIGELRPRFVIVENSAALLGRGLGVVLGDLAALGYDAWWDCIPASALGAPHTRDRIWILATNANAGDGGSEQKRQHKWAEELSRGGPWRLGPHLAAAPRLPQNRGWEAEPPVGRMAHGLPGRVDRLGQLGNAVVPDIPELLGRAIRAAVEPRRIAA